MAHILLIDDDVALIDANKLVLTAKGHEVAVAYTGDEAWQALEKRLPDLVVMDVMMEEFTSGFTLAEDVHIKHPDLPVLMLTGVQEHMSSDWKFDKDKDANWLPVCKFLAKPITPTKLSEEIDAALKAAAENKARRPR
ncbi:MAG TPA: response regulator [Elusimicrobiales bacterium]|nr:response regulator [Elusimicrobiales bacterium]